jgi:TonB family protein
MLSDDLVVRVDVTVNADGTVRSVRVVRSSGKTDADEAAAAAARHSRYRPASRNCTPVSGHYAFVATFVAPVMKANDLPPER